MYRHFPFPLYPTNNVFILSLYNNVVNSDAAKLQPKIEKKKLCSENNFLKFVTSIMDGPKLFFFTSKNLKQDYIF